MDPLIQCRNNQHRFSGGRPLQPCKKLAQCLCMFVHAIIYIHEVWCSLMLSGMWDVYNMYIQRHACQ